MLFVLFSYMRRINTLTSGLNEAKLRLCQTILNSFTITLNSAPYKLFWDTNIPSDFCSYLLYILVYGLH